MKNEQTIVEIHDSNRSKQSSRDVSIDEDSQINSKILSLIENELRHENRQRPTANFVAESRPQSLSFYEEDPPQPNLRQHPDEELTGDLEVVSPKKRRKRHPKSRTDPDSNALTSSRERILPQQRTKRKHVGKKSQRQISTAILLDELEDDVFTEGGDQSSVLTSINTNNNNGIVSINPNRYYIQRRGGRFEAVKNPPITVLKSPVIDRQFPTSYPLQIALGIQNRWIRFTHFCHGLLAGLALGHCLYLFANYSVQDAAFLTHYSTYSRIYVAVFYILCTICCVSTLEKIDLADLNFQKLKESKYSTGLLLVILYFTCLIVHLSTTRLDYKIGLDPSTLSNVTTMTDAQLSTIELSHWNHLSIWRSILAFLPWILLSLLTPQNQFETYLKNLQQYLPK